MAALRVPLAVALVASSVAATASAEAPQRGSNTQTYSQPDPALGLEQRMPFVLGEAIFSKLWVQAPSSTTASDGLGPLYNARSCAQCHAQNGRGRPPDASGPVRSPQPQSALVRLSIPAPDGPSTDDTLGVVPEPTYGRQLQTHAIGGHNAEGRLHLYYTQRMIELNGGERVELRQPVLEVQQLGYGPLHPQTQFSLRIAPPLIGQGLLQLIPEQRLEQLADPDDRDGDGISGRLNRVWDRQARALRPGRFGWKAGQPSLSQQNASALASDLGISSPRFPKGFGDCTARQPSCRQAPNGNTKAQDGVEASAQMLQLLDYYTAHLAVPAQRDPNDPVVQQGARLFQQFGCERCHTEQHVTVTSLNWPVLGGRTISPYTDLLLHDMGERLADQRPEFRASGREWRTPPLWGLGLTEAVNGNGVYLHDGRARTLTEAILWHDGEAAGSQQQFIQAPGSERLALIRFLESL